MAHSRKNERGSGSGTDDSGLRRNLSNSSYWSRQTSNKRPGLDATANLGSTGTNAGGNDEFDEFDAEFGPDARVWKTYVKETDKFDMEHVAEWNRSLDVTLIIAGLFTAMCTAFVIESYKSLKEDPGETSAQLLDQVVDLLSIIANGTVSQSNSTKTTSRDPFSPRHVDLWINALWFFALTLSAAVSFIAMLAKQWCYTFLSNRVGEPWPKTIRRQLLWKGIEKWKMEHVVMFLPSLVQFAFVSFAIGLCIFLGELSVMVAIPTMAVTSGLIAVYMASTFLPLLDKTCPYTTALFRIIRGPFGFEEDEAQGESIAVDAVAWLIKNSEDPESVNIALQAIAGARNDNPKNKAVLEKLGAAPMINKRLIAISSYTGNHAQLQDLYERAYLFFNPGPSTSHAGWQGPRDPTAQLRSKLRKLGTILEQRANKYVADRGFIPSIDIIEALRIVVTAPSDCLQSLTGGATAQLHDQVQFALSRVDQYLKGDIWFPPPILNSLVMGLAILLARSASESDPHDAAGVIMQLLDMNQAPRPKPKNPLHRIQFSEKCIGLLLQVFVICRTGFCHDNRTHTPPPTKVHYTAQAIDFLTSYASNGGDLGDIDTSKVMIDFGLLHLLSEAVLYKLSASDFKIITTGFVTISDLRSSKINIPTLPPSCDIYHQAITILTQRLSDEPDDPCTDESRAISYLTALFYMRPPDATKYQPTAQVYAFVVAAVCRLPLEPYVQNVAFGLMRRFYRYLPQSADLVQALEKRETLKKLIELARRDEDRDTARDFEFVRRLFAKGQAWVLLQHALRQDFVDYVRWRSLLAPVSDESAWDTPKSAKSSLQDIVNKFADGYQELLDRNKVPRHEYFTFLRQAINSERGRLTSGSAGHTRAG